MKFVKEFFKLTTKDSSSSLPVPSMALQLAIREVKQVQEHDIKTGMKWSVYGMILPENKAQIAQYAAENGVSASLRHFKTGTAFANLKENTVHGWVKV